MIELSILIPTLPDRKEKFQRLFDFISNQSMGLPVEILSNDAGKELSIGLKRNELYKCASGIYSVQIDDDDIVAEDYVLRVFEAIKEDKDCIGYNEHCVINGNTQKSLLSLSCGEWRELRPPVKGYNYHRTPFFKTPIKTKFCVEAGVSDMRFGEDHDFAKRIYPLLKTETFIDKDMYFYSANSLSRDEHLERYGELPR